MILSDIISEARLRAGEASNDRLFSDDAMTVLVNAAIRRYNSEHDWPWMKETATVTTVPGDAVLTLAALAKRVERMSYEDREVRYRVPRDQADFYGITGSPRYYTQAGADIVVLPTPDAAYTLDYTYLIGQNVVTDLSLAPRTPDWAIDPIISMTNVFMARRARNESLSSQMFAEYAHSLSVVRDEQTKSMEGRTPRRTRAEDRPAQARFG